MSIIYFRNNKNEAIPLNTVRNTKKTTSGVEVTPGDIGAIPVTGGTMTGPLTLAGDPTHDYHAATKRYVDNSVQLQDAEYVHDQISSSNVWTIQHNLGKYPSVTIVDTGGNVVAGDISYVSDTKVIITFNYEFSGKAYLN